MRVLLDTNIVLDVLLQREPFCNDAKTLFELVESNRINGFLCATSITKIYYLISKSVDKVMVDDIMDKLLELFGVADVNKKILVEALKNNGKDFEDSVIYTSVKYFDIDIIITRDKRGFRQSDVKVLKPDIFLREYSF